MLNSLYIVILFVLFMYVAVFTVYFSVIVAASFFKNKKRLSDDVRKEYKNLIVIIYSHNNEKTIVNLLEQLNKQDYPRGNYQIHIILDNCTDDSSNKLEFVGGAKLWRLTDDQPLGRDKAVSWLLENLMSFKKVDGYVFLNANTCILCRFWTVTNHIQLISTCGVFISEENQKCNENSNKDSHTDFNLSKRNHWQFQPCRYTFCLRHILSRHFPWSQAQKCQYSQRYIIHHKCRNTFIDIP